MPIERDDSQDVKGAQGTARGNVLHQFNYELFAAELRYYLGVAF
jgi:hypothetical protein